jgi:hypothetical protein
LLKPNLFIDMTQTQLQNTIVEADRFLARAKALIKYLRDEEVYSGRKPIHTYSYPKESGAVKRASLDLTRSLAELRKS